jgi:K(+)-stimulated pyrophosphate-energized sodium pump
MILAINRAMRRITKGSALRQWMVAMALCGLTLLGAQWARAQEAVASAAGVVQEEFHFFAFMTSDHYSSGEKMALWAVLGVAFMGLGYALLLVKQVREADQGTEKMQKVAAAIRSGANAYLGQQFRKIVVLIGILTVVLFLTRLAGTPSPDMYPVAFGRAGAFLAGSLFSFCVGFVGMRFATLGNLRVAAAARTSFGGALQVGYRTGTITGMLTDGLGLLGGTVIFMMYGEKAYEVLLGFGFGGTLIALFMRVGGGIYTKAADVGADLVGKIEAGIPEDDPRNAATIADNVGDNVGDCAGMAADIFESYEVTIVAAMILGFASFGHKGVIFPLLVRAIGVIGSIISTYSVRSKEGDSGDAALHSVHRGFLIGSVISVIGFFVLGYFYLHFDAAYLLQYPQSAAGFPGHNPNLLPYWANLGIAGLDLRPALTCLIGVFLAVALNKCTSYFTHTSHDPVRSLVKACQTGHATNIIQGFATGYESAVWATLIIAAAIGASVAIYSGTSPIFVAYGVAMCGIGMLTLTGNTISMDVFGPVADNANGIGEMGYEPDKMGPEATKKARQILADLDAVGNTTKAETKGIAIGSAVIAAVSLFASFIAVMTVGSEEKIASMDVHKFIEVAGKLTVADPTVFIGLLIGGTIPFLFSSMTIRAVGRAAFLIVKECRLQFRDKEIWAGTKTPDYGRVVGICTQTAQKELIGPGLLAILAPLAVGFLLGPLALAGFLAGMILVGQLLAVFMANAGGAWDNAKKLIEDEPRDAEKNTGKGSERHRAAVTGDTVGDPLKDTAGPAINPLIKVMNMVSLLTLPLVLKFHKVEGLEDSGKSPFAIALVIALIAIAVVVWAVHKSKQETPELEAMEKELEQAKT